MWLAVLAAAETAADFAGILYTDAPANGEADRPEFRSIDQRLWYRILNDNEGEAGFLGEVPEVAFIGIAVGTCLHKAVGIFVFSVPLH